MGNCCKTQKKRNQASTPYLVFASYHSELLSRKHQNDQKYKFSAKDFIINGVNFDSNYKIIQEINEITLVGQNLNTQVLRQIKIIPKKTKSHQKFQKEIKTVTQLDHPNIIRFYEIFDKKKAYYVTMDHCEEGELFDYMTKSECFTEFDVAILFLQILKGVAYIHENGFIHNNLHPKSILCEKSNPYPILKITDFGCFVKEGDIPTSHPPETLWRSPEAMKNKITQKSDMWACGMTLYFMLSGQFPNEVQIEKKNILENGKIFKWYNIQKEAQSLINSMICPDANLRISAQQAIEHKWFRKFHLQKNQISGTVLQSLKKFQVRNDLDLYFKTRMKLQDAFFRYFVNATISAEDKRQLLDTFEALDKNHDGKLSKEELIEGFFCFKFLPFQYRLQLIRFDILSLE